MSRYRFIAAQRDHYLVRLLCQLVEVPASGYYAWQPAQQLTCALQRAFWAQPPTPGLLGHADRGEQYCGNAYRQLLHNQRAVRSQSRRGDCYDNAQAESLWSRLKIEVLEVRERPVFANSADAQVSVAGYLTTTITSTCMPALTTRRRITFTNNFFTLVP